MLLTAITASPPGAPKTKMIPKSKGRDPFSINEMQFCELQLHICMPRMSQPGKEIALGSLLGRRMATCPTTDWIRHLGYIYMRKWKKPRDHFLILRSSDVARVLSIWKICFSSKENSVPK